MTVTAPAVYRKTRDQVIETLEQGLRDLGVGWEGMNEGGLGWAFVRLFTRLSDLSVQRLNQVPDKHFFAFLNSAGIDFVPPSAAETELTFTLADDAPESVLVPQGSQMATVKTETEAEIVFETEKDLILSRGNLVRALAVDPRCLSDRTAEALCHVDGSYAAFEGSVERARIFYLGDETLFMFDDDTQRAGTTITLIIDLDVPGNPLTDGWSVLWKYYDGERWTPLPKDCVNDGTSHFSRSGQVTLKNLPPLSVCSLDNGKPVWIVLALTGGTDRRHLPVLRSVTGSRSVGLTSVKVPVTGLFSAIQTGMAFLPVDMNGEFYPLGKKPSRLDAFYISAGDAFGKAGGECTISMTLNHGPDTDVTGNAVIAWEYPGSSGWTPLAASLDTTSNFRTTGAAVFRFTVPRISRVSVNGVEGFWIRARLGSGGYEQAGTYAPNAAGVMTWTPPRLAAPLISGLNMRLSYSLAGSSPADLTVAVGSVDGMTVDYSGFGALAKHCSPFSALDEGPAFYLGYDRAFPSEKWIQIRMDVDEDAMVEEYDTPVVFEYFNGASFAPLRASDGTRGFKSKGYLGFFAPKDHAVSTAFGTQAFWIRIRPETEGSEGPYLKTVRTNTVPAVNAETFRDVVIGSSDGKKNQSFSLPRSRVLPGLVLAVLEPDRPGDQDIETLAAEIEASGFPGPVFPCGSDKWVRYVGVSDFYGSGSSDRHFMLDSVSGTIRFGDGVRGAIPPMGQDNIRLVSVRYHDGARGNLPVGTVSVVRSPAGDLAKVKRVTNAEASVGGADVERMDSIRERGPQRLKHRDRAVTHEDYVWLAREAASEVRSARCFPVTDALGLVKPGHVTVVITPESRDKKPVPGPSLVRKVKGFLESHALANLGSDRNIHVKGPSFVECSVNVTVTAVHPEKSDQVELAVLKRLDAFLHPLNGGPERKGWTLGRDVYLSEVSAEIEQVDGVDHVSAVTMSGSLQQFFLDFSREKDRFRQTPFDLVPGSRVATFDERVRGLLADPVAAGSDIEGLVVFAFKAGDTVSVVSEIQSDIAHNLRVRSVLARPCDSDSDLPLTWEIGFETSFERPADWEDRDGLMSADGRLRMNIEGAEMLDEEGRISGIVISAFSRKDRICIVQGGFREPVLSFMPLSQVRFSDHRVVVPEDCLVFSGIHDVTMALGD